MQRVFVYGTLRKDQPNHHLISSGIQSGDCKFEGLGLTETKYPLVVATRFNVPFLLDAPNVPNAHNVEGEVYTANEKMMGILDGLERHPEFYTRCEIPILFNDKPEKAWCYLMQKFRQPLLELPFNRKYDSKEHAPYLSGEKRPIGEEARRKFMAEIKENL